MDPHPENWFEVIGAGDVVAAKKPAPDIYHWVLQRLALAPQECFAFEDSENGLQSALSAGLKTLVTVNAYTQHQNFCGATAVLSDLGEPEHSFTVLQGDTNGQNHVNMELLRYWHDRHDAP
jgi:beta-phosphoglucomutase-like phosphatase (HAD superfamily)